MRQCERCGRITGGGEHNCPSWSDEEIDILKNRYEKVGSNIPELKEQGRTTRAIRAKARKLGLSFLNPEPIEKVKEMYKSGMTQREIAEKLGVGQSTIAERLGKTEIEARHRYNPNLSWTPILSYILGVMDGDGTTYQKDYLASLVVADEGFARKFRRKLGQIGLKPSLRVDDKTKQRKNNKCKSTLYHVNVYSKQFFEWYEELDTKEKAKKLKENETCWNYLEGLYESDGTLLHNKNPSLTTTDDEMKELISEVLNFLSLQFSFWESQSRFYIQAESSERFFENIDCCIERRNPKW